MEDSPEELARPASGRRSTLRNNTARQVAVNFMPSRQLPYNTIRLRRNNSEHNALLEEAAAAPDAVDAQVNIIVREMEQHQRLMEDNLEAEGLRREALRDLPQGLTMKRNVRAKLSASVSLRSKRKPISMFKRFKYKCSFAWQRGRDRLRDFTFSIELWYEAIRAIEGHFGSAVGSYFYFLRWLFAMNLALATLMVGFVVTPQVLHDEERNTTGDMGIWSFLSGKGGYEDSPLFYGHYYAGDITTVPALTYNMPFAYFFTMVSLYILFFAILCFKTAYSYRRNFIETSGGLSDVYANKVFCGWDFGIASSHAAALNARSLYNEFKELLYEQNKERVKVSACTKVCQYLSNAVVWGVVVLGLGGVGWAVRALAAWRPAALHMELVVSAAITAVLAVFPLLFTLIIKLEYYHRRTAIYVTLARTWLLDMGTLVMLLFYWSNTGDQCWESSLGQETYRLVMLDTLVSLFILPAVEFIRALIYKCKEESSPPQFDIAYNSLTLIYNQAVLWVGLLFSPLLVVAVTAKFLLLFYVKRECAIRACQPSRKVWRAAQTQTVFYMLVTLSLFVALLSIGSLFVSGSSSCGPFAGYGRVFEVASEGVLRLAERPRLRAVLVFLTRPGVVAFLALLLCVGVYHMRAKAMAQRSMVRLLQNMVVLQAKDKEFLLTAIAKVSNGEWLYSPKSDVGPDSHTFKYLKEVRRPSNVEYHLDGARLNQSVEGRPRGHARDSRPSSAFVERPQSHEDGDTDSSFSWQGSSSYLNQKGDADKKWI